MGRIGDGGRAGRGRSRRALPRDGRNRRNRAHSREGRRRRQSGESRRLPEKQRLRLIRQGAGLQRARFEKSRVLLHNRAEYAAFIEEQPREPRQRDAALLGRTAHAVGRRRCERGARGARAHLRLEGRNGGQAGRRHGKRKKYLRIDFHGQGADRDGR